MAERKIIPATCSYIGDLAAAAVSKRAFISDAPCAVEENIIKTLSSLNEKAYGRLDALKAVEAEASKISDNVKKATFYSEKVVPAMNSLRETVDEMEAITASDYWPLPSYGDMLFGV